jgi:hypothetical protein
VRSCGGYGAGLVNEALLLLLVLVLLCQQLHLNF